jgi:tRNA pseudouridine55 synthase
VEPFTEPRMFTLEELRQLVEERGEAALDAVLLPIEAALIRWPRIVLDAGQAGALGLGKTVQLGEGPAVEAVNIVDQSGRSLGLGELDAEGVLRSRRLFRWAVPG